MFLNRSIILFISLFFCTLVFEPVIAQEPPISPGKVSAADFNISSPLIDTATGAIIIADIGKAVLENKGDDWTVLLKRTVRIKILNKNGFDACTVHLKFSAEDNRDKKLKDLEAFTYNLNGSVVEKIPVPANDFFLERNKNSDLLHEKFTFPAIREGSIIEYSYSIRYSYVNDLYPWTFQDDYPVLWSEFTATIPDLFNFAKLEKGLIPYHNMTIDSVKKLIWVGNGNVNANIYSIRWIMKDLPEIKKEPMVFCSNDNVSSIRFQISTVPGYYANTLSVLRNWQFVANMLLSNSFGESINSENNWLNRSINNLITTNDTELTKARKIFAFVRDEFNEKEVPDGGLNLEKIFDARQGSSNQLNLLLIAMLRKAKISADPVLISTRANGKLNPLYPILENVNYTIVRIEIDNREYFLDASVKRLGFGKLPLKCYNNFGMVIGKNAYPVNLSPDLLQETVITVASLTGNNNKGLSFKVEQQPGYFKSQEIRATVTKDQPTEYIKQISQSASSPLTIENVRIDSVEKYDKPVVIRYDMKLNTEGSDVIYFNPIFKKVIEKNPFVSTVRTNPIELPYLNNQVFELTFEVPVGYEPEEMPKSEVFYLNENDGSYEYEMYKEGDKYKLQCKFITRKTVFTPEEYKALREFYSKIIKKESEMMVFRKKK